MDDRWIEALCLASLAGRRLTAKEDHHYILTAREPIDEEYLLNTHGSGRYMLILRTAQGKQLGKHLRFITRLIRQPSTPRKWLRAPRMTCTSKFLGEEIQRRRWSRKREPTKGGRARLPRFSIRSSNGAPRSIPRWSPYGKTLPTSVAQLAKLLSQRNSAAPAPQPAAAPDLLSILTQVKLHYGPAHHDREIEGILSRRQRSDRGRSL